MPSFLKLLFFFSNILIFWSTITTDNLFSNNQTEESFIIETPKFFLQNKIKFVLTKEDTFAQYKNKKIFIPKNTRLKLIKIFSKKTWFKVIIDNNVFFIKKSHVQNYKSYLKTKLKKTPIYKTASDQHLPQKFLPQNKKIRFFAPYQQEFALLKYKKYQITILTSKLYIPIDFNKTYYQQVPITKVLPAKTAFSSPFLDELSYASKKKEIFVSKDLKTWYILKNLPQNIHPPYKIAVNKNGCLIVNRYISCNFGKSFFQILPFYIAPAKRVVNIALQNNDIIFTLSDGSIFKYLSKKRYLIKLFPEKIAPIYINTRYDIIKFLENKFLTKSLNFKFFFKDNKAFFYFVAKQSTNKFSILRIISIYKKNKWYILDKKIFNPNTIM